MNDNASECVSFDSNEFKIDLELLNLAKWNPN